MLDEGVGLIFEAGPVPLPAFKDLFGPIEGLTEVGGGGRLEVVILP